MITTETGLQYEILTEGNGEIAKKGNSVEVHYTGWLTDGTKFDSSKDRNQTFSFELGTPNIIKGWNEGVAGMKVGETRVLLIPYKLGYGINGYPGVIPPKATLKFEIELIAVK